MTMAQGKATGRKGLKSSVKAALAVAALVLLVPAAAQAHTGAATVSCDSADFTFKLFQPGSNTVHYSVTVDGTVAESGDFVLNQNGGRAGALHVPLNLTGDHYVVANAWWGPAGVVNGEKRSQYAPPLAKQKVYCPAPPVTPPSTPPAAPPASPPAVTPPAAAPAATPPASGVAGVQVRSPATARAAFASSCASHTAQITIRGTQMRSVAVSVNGHRVRTVRVSSKTRTLRVRVPIARGRAQIVSARVSFRNGTAAKTLTNRAVRCAAAQVAPQFTG
jgi:hypothetical protein